MAELPKFEGMCREAYRLLGDAADRLYWDWSSDEFLLLGGGPTAVQAEARDEAVHYIRLAKAALNRAAP